MNNYELEKVAGVFSAIKKVQRRAKMKSMLKKIGKGALMAGGAAGAAAAGYKGLQVGAITHAAFKASKARKVKQAIRAAKDMEAAKVKKVVNGTWGDRFRARMKKNGQRFNEFADAVRAEATRAKNAKAQRNMRRAERTGNKGQAF